ncbi:MAG: hypothetical protein ABH834_02575 [Candidatus Altiarchaeota archaeon]
MRVRVGGKRFWFVLLSLILLVSLSLNVFPASGNVASGKFGPDEGEDTVAYAEGASTDMAKEATSDMIKWMMRNPVIYDASASPPIPTTGWRSITIVILKVLVVPYQLLILLTGIYITYVSMIPRKRAYAKNYLLRLLVGLVLTTMAPVIFEVILEMEHFLLFEMVRSGAASTGGTCATVAGCPMGVDCVVDCMDKMSKVITFILASLFVWPLTCTLGPVALIVVIFTYAVVWARFVVVSAFGVIFPATVFLYMWNYTTGIGRKLMKYTFVWIFMPLVQTLFLLVMAESVANLKTLQAGLLALGGFIGVFLSPLIMTGMLKVAGGLTYMAGSKFQSPLLTGAGGLMYGMGPGALASAGSQAAYRRAGIKGDTSKYGGVDMAKERPSIGPGIIRGVRAGFQQGGIAGAIKGAAAGAWGTPSAATKGMFESGMRQLTKGKTLPTRALGLAKVVGAPLQHVARTKIMHPAGIMLTSMFHEQSDLAPKWISTPLNKIGEGLIGDKPIRNALKGLGESLGMIDDKGKVKWGKVALTTGVGMALFTPFGWGAIGLGVGLPLATGFTLGSGLSLRKVTEAYGQGRASGRGVIRSAFDSVRAGINLRAGKHAFNLDRLKTARQRVARGLKQYLGNYEDRLKNIHSGAKISFNHSTGKFEVSRPQGLGAPDQQRIASIESEMNASLNGQMRLGNETLGQLVNKRNDLDARIAKTEVDKAKTEHLGNSVEGMAYGERMGAGEGKKAGDLEKEGEGKLNDMGMSFGMESLSVQDVNDRAQALMNADPSLTHAQAAEKVIDGHIDAMSDTVTDKDQRKTDAKNAFQHGNNAALQNSTHHAGIAVSAPGTKAVTDANALYAAAENDIDTRHQAGEIDATEADARKAQALEAIGLRDRASGRRAADAEALGHRSGKGMSREELSEGVDVLEDELVRTGVFTRQSGGGIVRNRQAQNDREAMMLASYDDFNDQLTSSSSELAKREARVAKAQGKYRTGHAQCVQADMSSSGAGLWADKEITQTNRRNHEEYVQRIQGSQHMQDIFTLDDDRAQTVDKLLAQSVRGDETPEELHGKRQRIDSSLQAMGRAQHMQTQVQQMRQQAQQMSGAGATPQELRDARKLEKKADATEQQSSKMEEQATKDLQKLGLDPATNADIMTAQTKEAQRSGLLATRVVDTHQFSYDDKGNITHVSNPGVHYGSDWSAVDVKAIADGTASGTTKDANGNDVTVTPAALGNEFTVEAQDLYDYAKTGQERRRDVAKEEVYAAAEASHTSPEIAFHWKEGDRVDPSTGQVKECWVSAVDGLSDQAAEALYNSGVRTHDDLVAAVPTHRREASRLRRMADQIVANQGVPNASALPAPEKRQYDKLMAEAKTYDQPTAGVADKVNEQQLGVNGEIAIKKPDGTDTTMEEQIANNSQLSNEQARDMLDEVYETLNPRTLAATKKMAPRIRRTQMDWTVDQAAVHQKITATQERDRNPVRREINRLVDDIEQGNV